MLHQGCSSSTLSYSELYLFDYKSDISVVLYSNIFKQVITFGPDNRFLVLIYCEVQEAA